MNTKGVKAERGYLIGFTYTRGNPRSVALLGLKQWIIMSHALTENENGWRTPRMS